MIRPVAGVVLSLVAMAAFVFAGSIVLWFAVGVDRVLAQGSFDGTSLLNVWSVAVSIIGAVAAGWLCFRIAESRTAVIVLACLCLVMGLGNARGQRAKPEQGPRAPGLSVFEAVKLRKEPAWFTLLVPVVGVFGVLGGGGVLSLSTRGSSQSG
jgi:hypothetical protein